MPVRTSIILIVVFMLCVFVGWLCEWFLLSFTDLNPHWFNKYMLAFFGTIYLWMQARINEKKKIEEQDN